MELIYFPLRGRADAIRTMLVDNGTEYKETDCGPEWTQTWKKQMPFGQTPCLKDGDLTLVQSNAILRYLGSKFDKYGSNKEERYRADMVNDGVEDIRVAYTTMIYTDYDDGKAKYVEGLPDKFKYLEKIIAEKKPYILGEKVCFADYNLFDLLDIHLILAPECLDGFENLKAYHNSMASREKIKARRETDAYKAMPVNGNGKQ